MLVNAAVVYLFQTQAPFPFTLQDFCELDVEALRERDDHHVLRMEIDNTIFPQAGLSSNKLSNLLLMIW